MSTTIIYIISVILCLIFFSIETFQYRKDIIKRYDSRIWILFLFCFIPFLNTLYCVITIGELIIKLIKYCMYR